MRLQVRMESLGYCLVLTPWRVTCHFNPQVDTEICLNSTLEGANRSCMRIQEG